MECSVEISMYPLNSDYKPAIIDFIKRLRKHPFISIETNGMSTQVFGDYNRVIKAINTEIKNTFTEEGKVVFNLKVMNQILSEKNSVLMSVIEIIAVVFSILYVILAAKENICCWLCAAISVSLYIYICFSAKLYLETGLKWVLFNNGYIWILAMEQT